MYRQDYEPDLNFTLMPAIQALLKPDDDDGPKPRKTQQSYYRRPGRGHNNDYCDACAGGGDVICCDRCPASFHLECHDPPLTEKDIPNGQWLCHSCKMAKKAKLLIKSGSVDSRAVVDVNVADLLSSQSSRPSTPSSGVETDNVESSLPLRILPKRSNSALLSTVRLSLSETSTSAVTTDSPWDQLIKAASMCNPKKFDLPREMCVYQLFPGDERGESRNGKKNGKGGAGQNGIKNTKAGEVAPLPAKVCFSCRKSCKKAPLVSCDFCPLFFHQDCLDPPLTALPTTLWMCPVHPHQITDWKNISSMAATERVKLWSKFNPPVDQDTVKAQFLRRVHSDRLRTPKFKLKPQLRDRAQIPDMVRYHYRNPPEMYMSLKKAHRLREVERRREIKEKEENMIQEFDDNSETLKAINADLEEIQAAHSMVEGSQSDKQNEPEEKKAVEVEESEENPEIVPEPERKFDSLFSDFETQLKNNSEGVTVVLKQFMERGQLSSLLDEIQKSFPEKKGRENIAEETPPSNNNPRISPPRPTLAHERIQSRAVLTPVTAFPVHKFPCRVPLHDSILMRYRKLTIGTHECNDLILSRYGPMCEQQSGKHAVIFYDEATRTFELLNYSEHGSEINGQLYSLNFTRAQPEKERKVEPDVLEMVTELIDKKRGIKRIKYGSLEKGTEMATPEAYKPYRCGCMMRPPLAAGWEGSALLNHGYLLKFGCESFVFSIPDPFEEDSGEF